MSLTFTNLKTKLRNATGTTSANYTDANLVIDVNMAMDDVFSIILENNGWNVDDFNQTDYPIIYTNLVAGQRDYSFLRDETGNLILDIYRVQIKDSDGKYQDLTPVDQQSIAPSTMTDGQETQGTPTTYDKTSNGIFLDLVPSYSSTNGLKVFIDREPTYFTTSDTTKVAGFDGLCHDYLYLKPAYEYARDKNLANREALFRDLQVARKKLEDRYGVREKDIRGILKPLVENNK